MSPSTRADQGEVTTTNNLPPYLYWISTMIACATLLPAIYVACLMLGSYILTPTMNHTTNIKGTPGTSNKKGEDEAKGLETKEDLKEKVHVASGAEGVRKTRLTRTRRAQASG